MAKACLTCGLCLNELIQTSCSNNLYLGTKPGTQVMAGLNVCSGRVDCGGLGQLFFLTKPYPCVDSGQTTVAGSLDFSCNGRFLRFVEATVPTIRVPRARRSNKLDQQKPRVHKCPFLTPALPEGIKLQNMEARNYA